MDRFINIYCQFFRFSVKYWSPSKYYPYFCLLQVYDIECTYICYRRNGSVRQIRFAWIVRTKWISNYFRKKTDWEYISYMEIRNKFINKHIKNELRMIHCDAIRSEYFLILCRLASLLQLVVCSRMVLHISFKDSTSSAIAIKYPYLDENYLHFSHQIVHLSSKRLYH